ncbi:MAG: glycerophosphodiester phosphodiesterase, partial [Comamonadaceae bacterium]
MRCSLFDSGLRRLAGRCGPFLLATLACTSHAFDLQAHRGGRGLAPENTLAAFAHAMDLGVNTLELDIGLTADNVVVISHDTALNPEHTRDAEGAWLAATGPKIRAMTLAELQRYDVGRLNPASDYGKPFASQQPRDGERVPTLAALFDLVNSRGDTRVRFNIETKIDPTKPDETAAPEPMVRALLAEIDRAGMGRRVTVQSFDWRTLALVGQLAPQLPRAYLTSPRTLKDARWTAGVDASATAIATPRFVALMAREAKAPVTWSPAFGDLKAADVLDAHAIGLAVVPWTVNRRADMARLMDMGVDGLITDFPDVLRALMQ